MMQTSGAIQQKVVRMKKGKKYRKEKEKKDEEEVYAEIVNIKNFLTIVAALK